MILYESFPRKTFEVLFKVMDSRFCPIVEMFPYNMPWSGLVLIESLLASSEIMKGFMHIQWN